MSTIGESFPPGHVDERQLLKAVDDAIHWQKDHPHRDYLDAAYAVTAPHETRTDAGATFATSRWPIFIAAVKEAFHLAGVVS